MSALVLTIGLICALSSFHLAEAMQRCDYPRIDFECERVGVKKDVWQKFDLTLIKLDGECKEHVKYCVNDAGKHKNLVNTNFVIAFFV